MTKRMKTVVVAVKLDKSKECEKKKKQMVEERVKLREVGKSRVD